MGLVYNLKGGLISCDLVQDLEEGFGVGVGGELQVYRDVFILRVGYKSYDTTNSFSTGIRLSYFNFYFDYAFLPVTEENLYDFNQISIGYKF